MKNISDYREKELIIHRPSVWRKFYELTVEGETIGSMTYPRMFSSLAVIDLFDEQWEVYKPSIWKSVLEIRPQGYQIPIARYVREGWKGGGVFELPRGERLKYVNNIWKNINNITSASGTLLVSFKRKRIFGRSMHISIEEASETIDKFPWAVFVVWYVIQKQRQHAAAPAAAS